MASGLSVLFVVHLSVVNYNGIFQRQIQGLLQCLRVNRGPFVYISRGTGRKVKVQSVCLFEYFEITACCLGDAVAFGPGILQGPTCFPARDFSGRVCVYVQ